MVGDGARALIERGFNASGGLPPQTDLDQLFRGFLERYTAEPVRLSRPFDGLAPLLDRLAAGGLKLGICTNQPQAPSETLLRRLELDSWFQAVVGGDVLPVKKPDRGHLDGVLARLEVRPERAIMVGDSRNDVLAARACGVPCVLVSFGYTEVPAAALGADLVIDHLDDLDQALLQLSQAGRR